MLKSKSNRTIPAGTEKYNLRGCGGLGSKKIKENKNKKQKYQYQLAKSYLREIFDRKGSMSGQYHIIIDQNVPLFNMANNECLEYHVKIEAELSEIVKQGVITQQLVGNLAYPIKASGSLKFSSDPTDWS